GLTAERGLSTSNMLSASVDRALVHAAAEVVVLADHTKLGSDTMFQTVPTELITRLVTDEPPLHDERAAAELQSLADQGVEVTVAGPDADAPGGDAPPPGGRPRRDMPLPGQRRTQNGGLGPQLRSASALTDVSGEQRARVADLRRR
ncbi:DeoR family transcriptional regulator, partial [Streptomyces sp. SID7982]|nr:DeoR family transcriptional regulator [Streptomyces sp. SID7982]